MNKEGYQPVDARIIGTFSTRFFLELFGNSLHFPIANILYEILRERPFEYIFSLDFYILIIAGMVQAYYLTRWFNKSSYYRFLGNLIGPFIYTVIESSIEGLEFFYSPNHLAYWIFASLIGLLQSLRYKTTGFFRAFIIVIENIVRTIVLFFMYVFFEIQLDQDGLKSLTKFFNDTSHIFIGLAVLFFGLFIGLANYSADHYSNLLKETTEQLKKFSEWLFGPDLLNKALINPASLNLKREERTILFMDIRGFTRWSEAQSPEDVVNLLTDYYKVAENILVNNEAIKFKLSADEVMAVFSTPERAINAGNALRGQVNDLLSQMSLGVGIGLHTGLVIEGLLGSMGVKFYDVIGDTVNTSKRIESQAQAGEVLISQSTYSALNKNIKVGPKREISVKGKEKPIVVYPLEN